VRKLAKIIYPDKMMSGLLHPAFVILKENGGRLSVSELMKKVRQVVVLDDWAKEYYKEPSQIW
jgi:hypothetical protein